MGYTYRNRLLETSVIWRKDFYLSFVSEDLHTFLLLTMFSCLVDSKKLYAMLRMKLLVCPMHYLLYYCSRTMILSLFSCSLFTLPTVRLHLVLSNTKIISGFFIYVCLQLGFIPTKRDCLKCKLGWDGLKITELSCLFPPPHLRWSRYSIKMTVLASNSLSMWGKGLPEYTCFTLSLVWMISCSDSTSNTFTWDWRYSTLGYFTIVF